MKEFPKLPISEAKRIIDYYDSLSDDEFSSLTAQWSQYISVSDFSAVYSTLRTQIVDVFKSAKSVDNMTGSELDIRVGLCLYEQLTSLGFTTVAASDDDIWRYLSVKVFPDLTYQRYPEPEKDALRLNRKRFYSHTRRIWLKTLWWYIHLSWQGSTSSTYSTLQGNGSNIISHFIERVGKGYRVNLFRAFMAAYSKQPNKSDMLFRKAAKLNLAKSVNIEPELVIGGVSRYSADLFSEINQEAKP